MTNRKIYFYNEDNITTDYIKKYENIIITKVRKHNTKTDTNYDDYLNKARYALLNAKDKYSKRNRTLINKVINNSLKNHYKIVKAQYNRPLDEYINIDSLPHLSSNKYDPEYQLYSDWNYHNLKSIILSRLTWQEELVLILKEQNYNNNEISDITDLSINRIYYLNNQIKQKISKVLSS